MLARKGDTKMSWREAKSTGWAAFDLQQRQKGGLQARPSNEPFPSLPSAQPLETFSTNNHLSVKPFSSVVLPSSDYPAPMDESKKNKSSKADNSMGPHNSEISWENKCGQVIRELKELYSWADDSLIKDIMANLGNDFDKASSFLKAMISDESSEEHKDSKVVNSSCDSMELVSNDKTLQRSSDVSLGMISQPPETCSVLEPCFGDDNENMSKEFESSAGKLFDGCMEIDTMLGQLSWVPIQPEWEEDDVYLSCRKDALKMMRAASRHSKSATNSFLRGDHYSAQRLSQQAREEWAAAERLNAKAAREILSIRNDNNGIWKLDLHGLHAMEAVQALQERLYIVETQVSFKGSSPSGLPNSYSNKGEGFHASSSASGYNNMEKSAEQVFSRHKPIWLEVITGIGNHSRGGAALPTAVRTFLCDNGYRFDEARPGVIMVRPKFRL